jgi:hypothetical protein
MALFIVNIWPYFFISLLCSVGYLLVVSFLAPLLIQLQRAEGSGESAMIFLVIIYHPFILLLMFLAKWMYLKLF